MHNTIPDFIRNMPYPKDFSKFIKEEDFDEIKNCSTAVDVLLEI